MSARPIVARYRVRNIETNAGRVIEATSKIDAVSRWLRPLNVLDLEPAPEAVHGPNCYRLRTDRGRVRVPVYFIERIDP